MADDYQAQLEILGLTVNNQASAANLLHLIKQQIKLYEQAKQQLETYLQANPID